MRALFISIDESIFDRFVGFLKLFPKNKVRIEEIVCNEALKSELAERKTQAKKGEVIAHDEFWSKAGL